MRDMYLKLSEKSRQLFERCSLGSKAQAPKNDATGGKCFDATVRIRSCDQTLKLQQMLKNIMSARISLHCFKTALNRKADGGSKNRARGMQLDSIVSDGDGRVIGMQHEEQRKFVRPFQIFRHASKLIYQKA